jgi:hypothetical protein
VQILAVGSGFQISGEGLARPAGAVRLGAGASFRQPVAERRVEILRPPLIRGSRKR